MMKPTKLTFVDGKPTLVAYDKIVRKDNDRAYNYHRKVTEDAYLKFYNSTAWKHKRQEVLDRDYGLCQRCGMEATLVDHIIPSKEDWDDRLNGDNLQSLCRSCHRIKTKREWMKHHKGMRRYMDINLVCGLPASGKTTYVKQHMTKHDLIYDYDSLMQSLSGLPRQQSNHDIHDYIMLFLDQMLRKLRSEQTFNNVWIIRTLPDKRIDTLLSNYHHINHIVIDTDPNVCEQRLKQRKQNINFQKILNDFKKADFTGYRVVKNR
ncbi:MAG TPA: HNH endonuclease [Limosilactobacillus oris]|nr:HNH endonuclease [Limosilactobacillus oris]HJF47575.1 HNH endonuclease [Limosilactobacillus oris]